MNYLLVNTAYYPYVIQNLNGLTAEEVAESFGVTDPALYAEFESTDFDPACYNFSSAFTLIAGVVGFDLPTAKTQASSTAKTQTATEQQSALVGYIPEVLASQAILPELSRTPEIQAVLEAVNDLNTTLQANLAAIAAATTIDEVNNVVNPPTGIINIGRGQFGGPLDLNASNYIEFNSVSMLQSETELYAPATSSVVPYQEFPPDDFNSGGPIFATGDYLIQIRETVTSRVIAEFEVPLSLDGSNEDIAF